MRSVCCIGCKEICSYHAPVVYDLPMMLFMHKFYHKGRMNTWCPNEMTKYAFPYLCSFRRISDIRCTDILCHHAKPIYALTNVPSSKTILYTRCNNGFILSVSNEYAFWDTVLRHIWSCNIRTGNSCRREHS